MKAEQFVPGKPLPEGMKLWPDEHGTRPRDTSFGYITTSRCEHSVCAYDWIITDEKGRQCCNSTAMFRELYEPIEQEEERRMNKGEILVAIHNMRGEYAHEHNEALKRIGKAALEGAQDLKHNESLALAYYEAKAKVSVLDELLEKIANTPEDTGEVKHNHSIYGAQGNEIARAKQDEIAIQGIHLTREEMNTIVGVKVKGTWYPVVNACISGHVENIDHFVTVHDIEKEIARAKGQ